MIRLIAAIDNQRGLAKNGRMPWKIPEDEAYFTDMTKLYGGHVLTGRKTYETFKRPLAGRHNYVLTHSDQPIPDVTLVHDLAEFLDDFKDKDLWVSGGAEVFQEIINLDKADELYLTHIDADFGCDQFFPEYKQGFKLVEQSQPSHQNGLSFIYARYRRKREASYS